MAQKLDRNSAVRAVVFDYGKVLSAPPEPSAYAAMLRITGLTADHFETLYWADRPAYDEGKINANAFWQKFTREAGLHLPPSAFEQLTHLDAVMWTTENETMLAWQLKLHQRGFLTAILSNMGESVFERMKREFAWLSRFDVLVWSYQLGLVKPDPAIYHHVLKALAVEPSQALFIDDRPVNVEAANALGMRGFLFNTAQQLRQDLIAQRLDGLVPLPA